MKYIMRWSVALITLLTLPCNPMKRKIETTPTINAMFTPRDDFKKDLFYLLDNAAQQVLVATYLITEQSIIDRLISLKQKNLDIQIMFDEKSQNLLRTINTFLSTNIIPVIFPSTYANTLMHNKFLVIDGEKVVTGSANLTHKAFMATNKELNAETQTLNYENIVILESPDVAQKYVSMFHEIEQKVHELYIDMVSKIDRNLLPPWTSSVITPVYQKSDSFKLRVQEKLQNCPDAQANRLRIFFALPIPLPPAANTQLPQQPTDRQRQFLQEMGHQSEGISRTEASNLIHRVIKEDRKKNKRRRASTQ